MNIDNLKKLRDEILTRKNFHFDMERGFAAHGIKKGADGTDWCGTTGCIAGLAYALATPPDALAAKIAERMEEYALYGEPLAKEVPWPSVRATALAYLGFTNDAGDYFGHPLFDSHQAPRLCDREDAAAAIDRVIAGKHPWRDNA